MDVIGHDDEGVEFKAVLFALLLENLDQEKGVFVRLGRDVGDWR